MLDPRARPRLTAPIRHQRSALRVRSESQPSLITAAMHVISHEHAAIAGTVPARFLNIPGATPGGSASLTGHVDDVTIKVLEPFASAEALKATDFNVRVEYTVNAQEPTVESATADVKVVDVSISSREAGITQKSPGHLVVKNGVAGTHFETPSRTRLQSAAASTRRTQG